MIPFRVYGLASVMATSFSMSSMAQNAPMMPDAPRFYSDVRVANLPSNYHYVTLASNGLQVLVVEDKAIPLVTIELVTRNGAFVQTPELSGLAHLYEHMFFKANKTYPTQEAYLERVNELGIEFNGTTSEERVNYFFTLNKRNLIQGLEFMNSAARYPLFLADEMKRENVVVAGEFQRGESNPAFFLFRGVGERMWGDDYSRKNAIGEYDIIASATPQIMQDIKDRYYHPNNSMLVVAGDVDHIEVLDRVNRLFGDWKRVEFDIFARYPIPEFKSIPYSQNFLIENANAQVPIMMRGYHGPDTRKDISSTYAADIFSTILSQRNSKFQQALVESGLAYQAQIGYQTSKYTGPIQIILVPNAEQVSQAMKVLEEQIAMFDDTDYFTEAQLQTAKDQMENDDLYSRQRTSNFIHTLTFWWSSANLEYYTTYLEKLRGVTRADIQRYVKTYITGKPYVNGLLINPGVREQMGLDKFYHETVTPQSLDLHFKDAKSVVTDETMVSAYDNLVYFYTLNPDKKLHFDVGGKSKKVREKRGNSLRSALTARGIPDDKIVIDLTEVKTEKVTISSTN